jgi:hypothetical protein
MPGFFEHITKDINIGARTAAALIGLTAFLFDKKQASENVNFVLNAFIFVMTQKFARTDSSRERMEHEEKRISGIAKAAGVGVVACLTIAVSFAENERQVFSASSMLSLMLVVAAGMTSQALAQQDELEENLGPNFNI